MTESEATDTTANVAVLRGAVRGDPMTRVLPSGSVVVQFDLSTIVRSRGTVSNTSVPVAWVDPSSAAMACLADGNELVVVGTVQRRFFRVAGATQSRTEVVAESVISARRRKQVEAALDSVLDRVRQS